MQPPRQDLPGDATLEVGVDQHFDGPGVELGYVARLIDVTEGRPREERETRAGLVIPVGGASGMMLKVRPGRYVLEAVSPSGDVIDADVEVGPNETKSVRLEGEASPHEWLGWQTVSGNLDRFSPGFRPVESPARHRMWPWLAVGAAVMLILVVGVAFFMMRGASPAVGDVVPRTRVTGGAPSMASADESFSNWFVVLPIVLVVALVGLFQSLWNSGRMRFGLGAGKAAPGVEHASNTPPDKGLARKADPPSATAMAATASRVNILLVHTPRGAGEWQAVMGAFAQAETFISPAERPFAQELPPRVADATWRTFLIPGGEPLGGPAAWCLDLSDGDRGGLVKLALPWLQPDSGIPAEIEVLAPADPASGGRLSATVRDPRYATLLGYLAGGRITEAQAILEDAEEALFQKMANPYAAAAGGYVLLAGATTFEDVGAQWRQWLANLDAYYPWLPDAATLQGINLLQTHSPGAREKLLQAHDRGLPVFTEGLRRLREGLTYVLEDDADGQVSAALARVDEVSARCDPQQIFTCLRLGR
jgi:hypothetical protein